MVRERHLVSEAYDSRLVKSLPDGENPLARVNRLCFLLRLFLDGHTHGLRPREPARLARPLLRDDEPARQQDGEGGNGPGPGNGLPEYAEVSGFLQGESQLRGLRRLKDTNTVQEGIVKTNCRKRAFVRQILKFSDETVLLPIRELRSENRWLI